MNVTTVDYLEIYVGDLASTTGYLCDGFSFRRIGHGGPETGLAGQRSLLLGQDRIRLLLTEGLTPEHPATRFVERHGDGVACLVMRTDDPAAGDRVLPGLGSLTHRMVGPDAAGRLPEGIDPLAADPGAEALLETIDHLALCVPAGTLDAAVQQYQDLFGFRQIYEERVEVGAQAMDSKVVQSPSAHVTLTIVAPDPTGATGQLDDFLRSHDGAGVQHVAFGTSDILTAVNRYGERGVRFLATPDSYYDSVERRLGEVSRPVGALRTGNVLVDRDHWGEMFQIFTESPFPRRTTFFELIERRGALTFGSNNIKALYEANERARSAAETRS
jgi:4-hydroxymandelate synthase